ncbi:MAG: HIRAN domain-containing protein [Caulobacter sp.]|nr:HIRAN domain-containing protein [Caulobacter sp.]
MEHWIEEAGRTDRLILAWQAPDEVVDRVRWAIGELKQASEGAQFRYFDGDEFAELNAGRSQADLRAAGYLGYPAFTDRTGASSVFQDGVLEAFMRRLPPAKRSDFPRYLEHFRLRDPRNLSPFSLLGITEARLPSDGFSLVDPLDPAELRRDIVFEIAGHRHNTSCRERLVQGQPLILVPDPTNEHDANAVRVEADGGLIGHVNRFQAPTIGTWLNERAVSAWLLRLNGTDERPRAFAFVRVRPLQRMQAA